ncbi:MAG: anion permease [SAR324 cluster bacterium]|jgi:PiT family inorganic phosphate transporter|uniref:Phosphate transporter n=1 Tax=marine metagenome TaxID=408172 RepID=A0A381NK72_9ZZZZ|nr:anion permease [SAR324 cluster bacterium]MDP6488441.1 anion permease [SAR324 cluster bacterium]MDP7171425.1 anion permease [SAR324 cluster bacterium]MDP7175652.1 anion permease [SAR324 cluster bacterium]MDP7582406.1 anion permease [SAR324 cluster bacterium]|tara:strand:+ start:113 stop:1372 length:1260 start_codon:yes stop_codon:yes gene_type:complete
MLVEYGSVFIMLAIVLGLYMTWGIGANDVANAMGTSVGSGAITIKQAIIIAAIFEFAGAFIAGGNVTKTIRKGIIDPTPILGNPEILVWGMLSALLAAALWLTVASWMGWPVSTTHSIIGAIVGFAMVGIGMDAVNWPKIGTIVISWVVSPMVGGTFSYLIMRSIQRFILDTDTPFRNAQRYAPLYIFFVGFLISLVTLFKGLKHLEIELNIPQSFLIAVLLGCIVAVIGRFLIVRLKMQEAESVHDQFTQIERIFGVMMLFTACAMAFAHGSNDVANGIGPMAAVVSIVQSGGEMAQDSALPLWILILGGCGIVLGLATLGYRVIQTIGTKITELVPTRGFSAELAAAATVVLASRTGIPVSTTHIAVGAVVGVGLARGIGALDLRVIGGIFMSWVITLPVGALLSIFFFFFFRGLFL